MLKEIFCSKFKQPKIVFHKGLNVILGDDNGSNSIGKSTMLLIIDYVFGGDTYAKSDVIDHIGQHEICFCFEFGEVNSYYKRKTAQSKTVFVTDAHYENEKELSLDDYRKILLQFYNIHDENVSFRNIVGLYSRIYGKDNCNEKFVLSANSKQSFDDSISCLIKIFGKYPEIQNRKEAKKNCEERYKTFCAAVKMDFIKVYSTKKDVDKAEKTLLLEKNDCLALEHQLLTDTSVLTPVQLQTISDLKDEMARVLALKFSHRSKLGKLQVNIGKLKKKVAIDIERLQIYFPSINIKEIEKINEFHEGLVNELNKTILKQITKEKEIIESIEKEEEVIRNKIDSVISLNQANKVVLDKLIELRKSVDIKEKAIADYKKREDLKVEKKDAKDMFEKTQNLILADIQNKLNNEISILNEKVEGKEKQVPLCSLSSKSYTYLCPDDSGTGTNFKNLVLFDLAILALTRLPFVMHDTLLLKNIEKKRMDAIMKLYSQEKKKQIFISFDELADYSFTTQKIAEECKVLTLSPGGNELFGISWSKKKTEKHN